MPESTPNFTGLTAAQVTQQRHIFGTNELDATRRNPLLDSLRNIVTEPMFILLGVACVLYFFLGDFMEAMIFCTCRNNHYRALCMFHN